MLWIIFSVTYSLLDHFLNLHFHLHSSALSSLAFMHFNSEWTGISWAIQFSFFPLCFSLHGDFKSANEWVSRLCGCPNMDLSCPNGSHPFSHPLLSSANVGWELPFRQTFPFPVLHSGRILVSLRGAGGVEQYKPMGQRAVLLGFSLYCNILSWYSASLMRTEGIFSCFENGRESHLLFFFFFFCAIPLTCGCFNGGSTARMELNCQSWDRLPTSITEVLQAAGVPGLYLPLWNGESMTYVTGPPWVFTRQGFLRCTAWLCCCTLNCSPDLLWILAFLSSSGLFPAVLVYGPKIFPSLQSNENQD